MFENDPHARGSIDRRLLDEMIRLCPETAPFLYSAYTPTNVLCVRGVCPVLEAIVAAIMMPAPHDVVGSVLRLCRSIIDKADDCPSKMRFGGTEEEIVYRGSRWSWDIARVAVASCQVRNLPARMVVLADTAQPYGIHVIIEIYRQGVWGAVDPCTSVVYRHADGRPASVLALMHDGRLVEAHARGEATPYTYAGQFRRASMVNYHVSCKQSTQLLASGVNAYYRTVFEMAQRGWPGGPRWVHGEADDC